MFLTSLTFFDIGVFSISRHLDFHCDYAIRYGRKTKHGVGALKLFKHLGFFQDEETQHSLECIQANQIFPRKQLIREDENLQVIPGHFCL